MSARAHHTPRRAGAASPREAGARPAPETGPAPVVPRALAGCFFLSGATSLLLEVVWVKQSSYLLGGTLYAVATVVAAFMGGLCLGSAAAGRRGGTVRRPLAAYAGLQLLIGVCGIGSIPVFRAAGPLFHTLYQSLGPGHPAFLPARFLLVFLLLAFPTTLMGMTLPIVVGAFARRRKAWEFEAGTLYGANTLGAVAGTIAAGFAVISLLGLLKTALLAAALDPALGVVALLLDPTFSAVPASGTASEPACRTSRQWPVES